MGRSKFIGVYATGRSPSVSGSSSRVQKKQYWFAWEDGWGRFNVQLLDAAFQPKDAAYTISADEFRREFEYQPRILVTPLTHPEPVEMEGVTPEMMPPNEMQSGFGRSGVAGAKDLSQQRKRAAGVFQQQPKRNVVNMPASSTTRLEMDTNPFNEKTGTGSPKRVESADEHAIMVKAAELDRELRAEFAVALAKWRRGDHETPLKVFEKMCNRSDVIPAHKHMYTDFAIDLRKNKLTDLAIQHYQKAAELAPDDSYVHFNLARIYYETGATDKAEEQLNTALKLMPDFDFASRFLEFLHEQQKKKKSDAGKESGGKS